ncbi:CRISPR-associated protein Cas4 [Myroides marinus]|uniref:CRISPR-associated protein Cas4 n=1 Tax=Myroides marinus TaxID=703342 RepID=UPI00074202FF|nr:CRISPR-associated protein Cas4 [Myroides marinus]KUF43926.1 CRISPR-associated protein Cas4 [Myroides marinus]MDM1349707.1 CRISPR-associated protein Cas4 [Myroides marinus]MDM1353652.1 CRISPR-associated protein Cas4 [Myroides marinus]MDM1356916.1 CRISPR-associated protein Cas4 [Myroides marinus]MDM1361694.1 CRISPR-associated protein Cas4 [Myroides marinus]
MRITGTHVAYYHVCIRKLWLFANGIAMEHTSDIVAEGKLIAETTYLDRARKYTELEIDGIKIDFYDAKNQTIHEVKKSDKIDRVHIAQVKYYLYILRKHNIESPKAILEYPKLKHRDFVEWNESIKEEVLDWVTKINDIVNREDCPILEKKIICKKCSYYDFCYIDEED